MLSLFFWQPDTETGDIVFVIQEKEHAVFKRKGEDLFMEHTLTLAEALCGFEFLVNHLDGRQLLIKSNPGEIIKPSELKHPHTPTHPAQHAHKHAPSVRTYVRS